MSKWSGTEDDLVERALIVGEFHPDADALDYIAAHSRADDGLTARRRKHIDDGVSR